MTQRLCVLFFLWLLVLRPGISIAQEESRDDMPPVFGGTLSGSWMENMRSAFAHFFVPETPAIRPMFAPLGEPVFREFLSLFRFSDTVILPEPPTVTVTRDEPIAIPEPVPNPRQDAAHRPLLHTTRRATPLHFGRYVTHKNSPIRPVERFEGYHVAVDYEVSLEERDSDVPVFAICDGTIVYSGWAQGYGGLVLQECRFEREDAVVIYGHLSEPSLVQQDSYAAAGEQLGLLAAAGTDDSGYTRKHLHLGIRKGLLMDARGYVKDKEEIDLFMDPTEVLPAPEEATIRPYWE